MTNIHSQLAGMVSISAEHWDVPMRVELRPYLEFNRSIALQLRELEARWEKQSHPSASQRSGNRRKPK
jgi:hypothetical protein